MKTNHNPPSNRTARWPVMFKGLTATMLVLLAVAPLHAGGTLTPQGASDLPVNIRSHQVAVTLQNGFARTEVTQAFFNPNDRVVEAIYAFPVPETASLSEVIVRTGERELRGEVLPKDKARQVYEEEKSGGNDAGLAEKETYQNYSFRIAPIPAQAEVTLQFIYYQAIDIDTGIGRYVYPLEDGGTDEQATSFWTNHDQVDGLFSIEVELRSAWPVTAVRSPGLDASVRTEELGEGHYRMRYEAQNGRLNRDFVFYYRLAENLPGRIEVIPYRASPESTGTFMVVVTPGLDLKPLDQGADYVYVLDTSGSMKGKFHTLIRGVSRALGEMRAQDRFRVITFSTNAQEVIPWTNASPANVQPALSRMESLTVGGSTNIYEGLDLALTDLDADRATSVVLVTDGVTNTGVIAPGEFDRLMKKNDVRLFGFLLGNSGNWPLMKLIADASGGFTAGVSNEDDIVGQILLAKSKITHESLHHASFSFSGGKIHNTTGDLPGKIYRGQQLVIFGRYDEPGKATVRLNAKMTGEDKIYTTTFDLPEQDIENPEIERLWAMEFVEQIERWSTVGEVEEEEARQSISDIGVAYQIVTDETSMVLLSDERFAERGIERRNLHRSGLEAEARSNRASQPVQNRRVDIAQPAFQAPAPSAGSGNGGGAFGMELIGVIFLGAAGWRLRQRSLNRRVTKS